MVALLTADSFNRANNASSLGSTNGAGNLDPIAWTAANGTWGISSNEAVAPVLANALAVVETGHSNVDVRLKIATTGGSNSYGLVFRYSDNSNYLRLVYTSTNAMSLIKRVAGVETTLYTQASFWSSGDVMQIKAINNVITIYKNGVAVARVIEPFNRSATKCGMMSNSQAYTMDDFAVWTVDVPAELATDTFNRADSTSLGSTDGAGSLDPIGWQPALGLGVSDIVSNAAAVGASTTATVNPGGLASGSQANANINYIDAGTPDVQIHAELDDLASSAAGIVFRYVDDNNYWLLWANQATNTRLFKRVSGTWTDVSGALAGMVANNRVMTVKTSGSTITCDINGVQVYTTADTTLQSATKHGFLVASGGTGGEVEAIQIWVGDAVTPVIAQVGPTQGEAAGGTDVTIVGNNFTGVTDVLFGSEAATSFTVISDGYIEAVSPAHPSGLTHIIATNGSQDSVQTAADQFTFYIPEPVVSSVTPNHGPIAGGEEVVITGAYFTGATSVKFGTTPATSFTVDTDGQITATTPAHIAGVSPIVVTTPWGTNG